MRSIRSRFPLLVALFLLVVTLRAALRQRRMLRLLGGVMLTWPGSGIVSGVVDAIIGGGGTIKDWVLGAIDSAMDQVWSFFSILLSYIGNIWDYLGTIGGWVIGVVNNAIAWVYDQLWWLISAVQSALVALIDTVRDAAAAALSLAVSALEWSIANVYNILAAVIDAGLGALQWALNHAVDLLSSAIDVLRDWTVAAVAAALDFAVTVAAGVRDFLLDVLDAAVAALQWVIDQAVAGIEALVDFVVSWVQTLVDDLWAFIYDQVIGPVEDLASWVSDYAAPLLDAVVGALDWLWWLATMPFSLAWDIYYGVKDLTLDAVRDAIRDATHRNRHRLDGLGGQVRAA